jgi:hypothetical protein
LQNPSDMMNLLEKLTEIETTHVVYQQNRSCTTSAFEDKPHRILRIIQRFGKHCSCHLQGEYVMVGCFWKPYTDLAL